jgi:hypothetical protein
MVVARGLVNIKYDIKINGKFLYVPTSHVKIYISYFEKRNGKILVRYGL